MADFPIFFISSIVLKNHKFPFKWTLYEIILFSKSSENATPKVLYKISEN